MHFMCIYLNKNIRCTSVYRLQCVQLTCQKLKSLLLLISLSQAAVTWYILYTSDRAIASFLSWGCSWPSKVRPAPTGSVICELFNGMRELMKQGLRFCLMDYQVKLFIMQYHTIMQRLQECYSNLLVTTLYRLHMKFPSQWECYQGKSSLYIYYPYILFMNRINNIGPQTVP